jgi:putative CocE/NonD family hydrolase
MTQWQTLKEQPEGLVTAVPTASVYPGWDYPNPSGIFLSYSARWLSFVEGEASQANLFGDNGYWSEKYREMYREHRPFSDLDDLTGLSPRVFQRWIAHPHFDAFWQEMSPTSEEYARLDIPILTITGHFDGDQPGAMKYYRDHMAAGTETGIEDHYLIIGPWSHGGTRTPQAELGGLTFGQNSVVDMEALHLAWFDWTLREGPRPGFLRDRVAYYVMDADEWRFAPSLGEVASGERAWHLGSSGPVHDVFHSGMLATDVPEVSGVDELVHDPLDIEEKMAFASAYPGGSYLGAGAAFGPAPKAVYHSPPLTDPLTVSGFARLELFLEMDVPDMDLVASLYEVRPNGTTVFLGESELRARHRGGVDTSQLVTPGRVELYTFDRFYWFSRRLHGGSRLRLVVHPMDSPDRDKNYQSGSKTIEETGADARTATLRIHHGPRFPSRLVLPVEGG